MWLLAKNPHFTQNAPARDSERYGLITAVGVGSTLFRMVPGTWNAIALTALMIGIWLWWQYKSRNKRKK
jgi:hypothetical protein